LQQLYPTFFLGATLVIRARRADEKAGLPDGDHDPRQLPDGDEDGGGDGASPEATTERGRFADAFRDAGNLSAGRFWYAVPGFWKVKKAFNLGQSAGCASPSPWCTATPIASSGLGGRR
jgi:hypothetical protein